LTRKIKKAFSQKAIAGRVAKLGKRIRKDAGTSEIFLLGILKGSSCFLADLLRAIPGLVRYGYIDVVRDELDTEVATALEIDFMSHIDIKGKNVYLLKDVVSTGVIENYLLTQLRQKKPASLKLVALLDHSDLRTVDIEPDYRVFDAGQGQFVGYGLEREGANGNLPYIGKV
jgi:hypoxanthine phosphoribosyltransferase